MLWSLCRNAHILTFSSLKGRPTSHVPVLASFGIPQTQLCLVRPPLLLRPSNEARRQKPDYLHWPRSVSSGRLLRHSRTESHWHGEREKKGGRKQALAPVSRPSSAGWWMSRTSWSLPPKASGVRLQWVTVSRKPSWLLPPPSAHPLRFSKPTHEPQSSPKNRSWTVSLPLQTLEVYPGLIHATTSLTLSTFDCDCTASTR